MGKSLVIHHRKDGTTTLSGGNPDEQVFPVETIARELAAGRATVTVTLDTTDPPTVFELVGFQESTDGRVNARVWQCRRIGQKEG